MGRRPPAVVGLGGFAAIGGRRSLRSRRRFLASLGFWANCSDQHAISTTQAQRAAPSTADLSAELLWADVGGVAYAARKRHAHQGRRPWPHLCYTPRMTLPHHNLAAWQRADDLFMDIHALTQNVFPREERYELSSQLRRAAYSVPANIVEGTQRKFPKESFHFCSIASASLAEVGYGLHAARRLGYLTAEQYAEWEARIVAIAAALNGLMHRYRMGMRLEPQRGAIAREQVAAFGWRLALLGVTNEHFVLRPPEGGRLPMARSAEAHTLLGGCPPRA